jgi:hypothetical protein
VPAARIITTARVASESQRARQITATDNRRSDSEGVPVAPIRRIVFYDSTKESPSPPYLSCVCLSLITAVGPSNPTPP